MPNVETTSDSIHSRGKLRITPLRAGVSSYGGSVEVLVEAFAEPGSARTSASPLNLAFVIDRSGSMSGRPLEQAKACVAAMIRRMKVTDRAALVIYDNEVQVPIGSAPVAEILPVLDQRFATIDSRGMTALHDGWLAGAEQSARFASGTALSRVILLSDGNANQGLTDTAEIARQCAMMADNSVSTSTYGLGDSFNEALMTEMAALGNGQAYYGDTADDLLPKFEAEFDALAATVGRDVSLSTMPAAQCLNDYRAHRDGGYLIPNLVEGAASWAMLRFELPALPLGQNHELVFTATYTLADGTQHKAKATLAIESVADVRVLPKDEKVADRLRELEAAQIQKDAKIAADRQDWPKVKEAIARLREIAGDNGYILGVADTLEDLARTRQSAKLSKEAHFASSAMIRAYSGLTEDSRRVASVEAPSFARREIRQGKGDSSQPRRP